MSASIAFNLQMTFLRSSRAPLPAYVEYLYYIVPISVVLLQFVPQYIWASKHGYCRAFDPVMPATNHYIVYIIFVQMGIPTIFIFYNVITCVWVILSLNSKQRKVSKALDEATARTKLLLDDSPNTSSLGSDSTVPKSRPVPTREQQQLMAVRRVYRACIRIALYPLAPLIWWICIGAFYIGQYFFSFTWKRDAYMMARFMELNWYTSFVTVLANFIVFLSDAAVLHVVSEVYKLVMRKLGIQSKHAEHGSSAVDKTKKRLPKKPSVAITESDKCATATVDDISLASADFNYYPASTPGAMEENRPYTSSIAGLQDDVVTRRVRGNADVKNFLDEM
ncbi:hypothetical protein EV181_000289 [Coemansia sp. RSA 532]|nr:hypothetical protein EV181_000289 [Coemansia sp. RSA 532]KAJ2249203.1 hypothetical protein GGH97_001418 [Coemansia sp. RSA 475]KAJ2292946.1 hypothetical protein IW141_001550 [Coemansia sp. RSA 355]